MTLKDTLKHAFAVDEPGPAEPTPEQQVAVDWLCQQVAKRHLTTPGLIAIEMSRPLNWLTAQAMHGFSPAIWAVMPRKTHEHYDHLARFLEQRGSFEYIARRVEHFEAEFERARGSATRSEPSSPVTEEDHDEA